MIRLILILIFISICYQPVFSDDRIIFKSPGEGKNVSFVFNGKRYPKGFSLLHPKKNLSEKNLPYERFLGDFIEANKKGDKASFLKMWSPEDRVEISENIKDQAMWEQN